MTSEHSPGSQLPELREYLFRLPSCKLIITCRISRVMRTEAAEKCGLILTSILLSRVLCCYRRHISMVSVLCAAERRSCGGHGHIRYLDRGEI